MMKKFITFVLACMIALPSMITCDSSSAASKALTYNITISVGETKRVTLPNKTSYKKYYSSTESNTFVSSYGTKGKKTFVIKGIKATEQGKPAIVTVTTTSGRKVKYKVVVQGSNSANDNSTPTTDSTDVTVKGDCPHCGNSDCLEKKSVTYTRPAVKTAYVKEPIKSVYAYNLIQLRDSSKELEYEAYIKSIGGFIVTKEDDSYDVLVPLSTKESVLNETLTTGSVGGGSCYAFYLSEVIVEDVEAEPAKSVTLDSGLVECTKCGYVGKQK